MSRIGYGCTKQKVFDMVQEIVSKDGRKNPFINDRPGEKWWTLFTRRHADISLRQPEHLQLSRARCCTPAAIQEWFEDFGKFLIDNKVKDSPSQLWNADESGFPLCPKTGRILAMKTDKNVYGVTGDSKEQITCLCAGSAAGDLLPPMEVFAGERFRYNPMEKCIPNAYFGRSPNGWINTEIFYGWLANHFAKLVSVRPVVLLVDGHSSHIDIEISKFCLENQILLYCLPPHSSHILQPLDVNFFKSLKTAWSKQCVKFRSKTFGMSVTKQNFSEVFKDAWFDAVKPSLLVNAFRESGICPLNPRVIDQCKLAPSMPYSQSSEITSQPEAKKVRDFEKLMKLETVKSYEKKFEEGYDVENDELYSIWSKLKQLSIADNAPASSIPKDQQLVSPAMDEVLVYPNAPAKKKTGKSTASMPKHLSSHQMIVFMEEKRAAKQRMEEEKKQRKELREKKREERQIEQQRKKEEKEKRKRELAEKRACRGQGKRGRGRGSSRGQGRGRGTGVSPEMSSGDASTTHCASGRRGQRRGQPLRNKESPHPSSDSNSDSTASSSESSGDYCCPLCGLPTRLLWVACDSCDRWFHAECTDIHPSDYVNLEKVDWVCDDCN